MLYDPTAGFVGRRWSSSRLQRQERLETSRPDLEREWVEDVLERHGAAVRALVSIRGVALSETRRIDPSRSRGQELLVEQGLHVAPQVVSQPLALGVIEALLVLAPGNFGWQVVFHRLAEHPLGPSVPELPLGCQRQQQRDHAMVEERQADLSGEGHRHAVLVMQQRRQGKSAEIVALARHEAAVAEAEAQRRG